MHIEVCFVHQAIGHGFLLRGGSYSQIDVPTPGYTNADGINDTGQVVGIYLDPGILKNEGYIWSGEVFRKVRYPGASTTYPSGINNNWIMVGTYFDSFGNANGFIAAP